MSQRNVFVDEKGNIINENDVETKNEEYIDESGNKKHRRISFIKENAFEKIYKNNLEGNEYNLNNNNMSSEKQDYNINRNKEISIHNEGKLKI
jgi:hypothetical protein